MLCICILYFNLFYSRLEVNYLHSTYGASEYVVMCLTNFHKSKACQFSFTFIMWTDTSSFGNWSCRIQTYCISNNNQLQLQFQIFSGIDFFKTSNWCSINEFGLNNTNWMHVTASISREYKYCITLGFMQAMLKSSSALIALIHRSIINVGVWFSSIYSQFCFTIYFVLCFRCHDSSMFAQNRWEENGNVIMQEEKPKMEN